MTYNYSRGRWTLYSAQLDWLLFINYAI